MKYITTYIKHYISIHRQYWGTYIFTMVTMPIAFVIGLVLILYFGFTNKDTKVAERLARLLFGVIGSLPLVIPNYKMSMEVHRHYKGERLLCFLLNQSISIIMYYAFYRIYFYLEY